MQAQKTQKKPNWMFRTPC